MVNENIFSFFATHGKMSQNIKAVHKKKKKDSSGTGMFLQKLAQAEVGRVMVNATYLTGLSGFDLALAK